MPAFNSSFHASSPTATSSQPIHQTIINANIPQLASMYLSSLKLMVVTLSVVCFTTLPADAKKRKETTDVFQMMYEPPDRHVFLSFGGKRKHVPEVVYRYLRHACMHLPAFYECLAQNSYKFKEYDGPLPMVNPRQLETFKRYLALHQVCPLPKDKRAGAARLKKLWESTEAIPFHSFIQERVDSIIEECAMHKLTEAEWDDKKTTVYEIED